jgi:hypothetical protein
MTQVSEVSRQYATGAKQTAAASSQIATLAVAMQHSISTFQVEGSSDVDTDASYIDEYFPADAENDEAVDAEIEDDQVAATHDEGVSLH